MLKALGSGALATAAVPSAATARRAPHGDLAAEFREPAAMRAAVADHAGPLLAELADRGFIAAADPAEFDFDAVTDPTARADLGVRFDDDGTTAEIQVVRDDEVADVDLFVRPHHGTAVASVRFGDGLGFGLEATGDDVTIQDCWIDCSDCCDIATSDGDCLKQERECCNPCLEESSLTRADVVAGDVGTAGDCDTTCDCTDVGCACGGGGTCDCC